MAVYLVAVLDKQQTGTSEVFFFFALYHLLVPNIFQAGAPTRAPTNKQIPGRATRHSNHAATPLHGRSPACGFSQPKQTDRTPQHASPQPTRCVKNVNPTTKASKLEQLRCTYITIIILVPELWPRAGFWR